MKMPARRALAALGAAVIAGAGVVAYELTSGSTGTPLQQGAAPMPSGERLDRLGSALIEELRATPEELEGRKVTVVPTTWQRADRFVMGRRFARGCRARAARWPSTSPSEEPAYAVVFEGLGLGYVSHGHQLDPDGPTPRQLRFRRCFPDLATAWTVGVIDEPTNQVIGAYWVNELPDLSPLGPLIEYRFD
jgi:hypothetical protein